MQGAAAGQCRGAVGVPFQPSQRQLQRRERNDPRPPQRQPRCEVGDRLERESRLARQGLDFDAGEQRVDSPPAAEPVHGRRRSFVAARRMAGPAHVVADDQRAARAHQGGAGGEEAAAVGGVDERLDG